MHKRKLHYVLKVVRRAPTVALLALLMVSIATFVLSYRHNNLTALQLRDNLLEVDKNNGDVESALHTLREYTYSHMNANLSGGTNNIYPPIQLKYRYERLVDAEKQRTTAANANLYTAAQDYCEQQISTGRTITRVPCVQEYLASRGGAVQQKAIPDALYKFDFVSPVWSPDLAGWSMVASAILLFVLIVRVAVERWLVHRLREHL